MKRLHPGFAVDSDCCVTNNVPGLGNEHNNPAGVYLGKNPESHGKGLYLTYWTAVEIAQIIGYPSPEVYEQMQEDLESQEADIAELHRQLQEEVHSLALKSVHTKIDNVKQEILDALEGSNSTGSGSDSKPGSAPRAAAKPAGRKPAGTGKPTPSKPL